MVHRHAGAALAGEAHRAHAVIAVAMLAVS
jgi:hypothetical protein